LKKISWYKNPSNLYLVIFMFSVFSGAVRKWVVGDGAAANIIFAVQMLTPLVFWLSGNARFLKIFENRSLTLYIGLLFIQAFNPMNLTFFHGVFGILIHSAFWVGVFFYLENRDDFSFNRNLKSIVIVGASLLVLAYIQYGLPPSHILNRYVNEKLDGGVATVGQKVRVTGTFSYISGFTAYLIFHGFLVWAVIKMNYKAYVIIGLLAGGFVAAFMSGSRSGTYSYSIFIAVICIYEFRKANISKILAQLFIPAVILFAIFTLKGSIGGIEGNVQEAYENFDNRRAGLSESGEEKRRLFWDLDQLLDFRGNYPVFGVGLGSTYQGAVSLYGLSPYVKEYGYSESELARYVLEGGFVLLIVKLILAMSMVAKLVMPKFTRLIIFIMIFTFNPVVFNLYNSVYCHVGANID
jgi:hypothetical protein